MDTCICVFVGAILTEVSREKEKKRERMCVGD